LAGSEVSQCSGGEPLDEMHALRGLSTRGECSIHLLFVVLAQGDTYPVSIPMGDIGSQ
jgi:hypothetical protein